MASVPIGYRLEIHSGADVTPETEAERQRIAEAFEDWDGGPIRLPGTRLPSSTSSPSDCGIHFCGGRFAAGRVACPACQTDLFPMFRLDMADPWVSQIVQWPLPVLELPVCPGCVLFHQDYFVDFSQTPFAISSAVLPADEEPLIPILTPYETRTVTLRLLEPDEYPGADELCDCEGHQIGGVPPRWYSTYRHNECPSCGRLMAYAAVIHYDDGNVPLFDADTRQPVAFCLGDCKSYYIFTCGDCLILKYRFAM